MFKVEEIRKDFPILNNNNKVIYFDNAATSYKPQCVIDKVNEFYTQNTANIHRGDYDSSFKVSNEYDKVRTLVKEFINARNESEIIFTSGASDSLNLLANGFVINNITKDDVLLTTKAEHASDFLPWMKLSQVIGFKIEYIELNEDGTFNFDNYLKAFNENVKFVCITAVSNVLGYRYPIKEITKVAHEHNAYVLCDGAQSVPHFKTDVLDLDVDFLSFSAHKMLGPSGVGVLYGKTELLDNTTPVKLGGGSNARFDTCSYLLKNVPLRFETGTPNIEGILGFGEAIKYINKIGIENIEEYDSELLTYLKNRLKELNNIIVYNPSSEDSIITLNVKNIFAQDVGTYLNKHNICVRTGNHCAKVLHNIIGTDDTIRISLYFYNTKEEIDTLISALKEATLENVVGAII